MVQIVLGVAVFVLAVAVVGLFAMMGELASRVPDPDQAQGVASGPGSLEPLAEARLNVAPDDWPPELAEVRDAARAHVIVFSASCATCRQIASGETGPLDVLPQPVAVMVSCPRQEAGDKFLATHPMIAKYPHVLDVRGDWLTNNFEVRTSPSVLVFEDGRLTSAHIFTAATALEGSSIAISDSIEEENHVHAGNQA